MFGNFLDAIFYFQQERVRDAAKLPVAAAV